MNKMRMMFLLLLLLSYSLMAEDWPDWRGENRTGRWSEKEIIEAFEDSVIPLQWKAKIGSGYSGPTVAKGKVYLMDYLKDHKTERVLCFDAYTGINIWTLKYACTYERIGYPAGPRASVVIENNRAYALGAKGHLHCLDANTGTVLWKSDLNSSLLIDMPIWGIAASPLLWNDLLILQIGGEGNASVIALDKNTGHEVWRNLSDPISYASPVITKQQDKEILIVWTGEHVNGLNPGNGELYWKIPFKQRSQMAISTPVIYGSKVFVSSFFNGSLLIEMSKSGTAATTLWQRSGKNERNTDALHCCMNTPIIMDECIFGVDSYGELRCLDLANGNRIWEDQTAVLRNRWANIHFVQNGLNTWMFNEQGEVLITQLSKQGFKEISRSKLIEPTTEQLNRSGTGVTWSHPAFANKHVYARNDSILVCADLSR